MVEYLVSKEVMNLTQHVFRHKRSAITQILSFYEGIISKPENKDDVDTTYLDFSKGFDRADHNILLHKIKALKITIKILKWKEIFLKKREQRVKINGHLSDWVWVLLGVSQGSALRPLLFLILKIDVDRNTRKANLGSFADDTRSTNCIRPNIYLSRR